MMTGVPIAAAAAKKPGDAGYVDILRPPDSVTAFLEDGILPLARNATRWTAKGVAVQVELSGARLPVQIEAAAAELLRVHLRWTAPVPEHWRILGDQWERSYGDLEWRGIVGDRILPWYFLAFDGHAAHGYGVATECAGFAFWQVDRAGISLWLDVRNGGGPVRLGERVFNAATVVSRRGAVGETAFESARHFCRALCPNPRLPAAPVYGGNNWYYAYGQNCSAADIKRDSALMAELAPANGNPPFMVIDDGWSPVKTAGPWNRGNDRFPDMGALAAVMKKQGVRPGIWLRPLCTADPVPESAKLPALTGSRQNVMDPSIPEMLDAVRQDISRLVWWGYELIKHDYTSFDLTGRWGMAMGAELTNGGWHFADRSRTTAEVALALYRAIREAAGGALIIGCNTFGHLAAGLVELQRTGDDTSGRDFGRTRRMGLNTLAFRAPQHGTFFAVDADCAPVTPEVPWSLASRWLDLVAHSGTALFVSPDPRAVNAETKQAMRRAFLAASKPQEIAEPLDWMDTTTPARWRMQGKTVKYDWYGPEGGTPFPL